MRTYFLLLLLFSNCAVAQKIDKSDSLKYLLKNETLKPNERIKIWNSLARHHFFTDSLAVQNYAQKALGLSKQVNDKKGLSDTYLTLGFFLL